MEMFVSDGRIYDYEPDIDGNIVHFADLSNGWTPVLYNAFCLYDNFHKHFTRYLGYKSSDVYKNDSLLDFAFITLWPLLQFANFDKQYVVHIEYEFMSLRLLYLFYYIQHCDSMQKGALRGYLKSIGMKFDEWLQLRKAAKKTDVIDDLYAKTIMSFMMGIPDSNCLSSEFQVTNTQNVGITNTDFMEKLRYAHVFAKQLIDYVNKESNPQEIRAALRPIAEHEKVMELAAQDQESPLSDEFIFHHYKEILDYIFHAENSKIDV